MRFYKGYKSEITRGKGDLVIADRIYGTVNGIAHCIDKGADFIVRLRTNCFAFYDENHNKVDIISAFAELKSEESSDVYGFVKDTIAKVFIPVRICAKRKAEVAIVQSREKLKRRATDKQHKLQPKTEIFNDYILVVTSLPAEISSADILETYRYRWQIEMYFKRLKSILSIGNMPKKHETSLLAWIDGKIMVSLLIEAFLSEISFFPNQNDRRSIYRETKFILLLLCTDILPFKQIFDRINDISTFLQVEKRRGKIRMQLSNSLS